MLDGIMRGQGKFEWSGLTEISSFWLRDSFFLPADKRSRSPSEHTHAGSLPATQRAAVASSFYECDVGVFSHPWCPTEGDLSLGDWHPGARTTRGHQVLKDLSVQRAAHRRLRLCVCVQREAMMEPPAGFSILPYLLGHGWVDEIFPGAVQRPSARSRRHYGSPSAFSWNGLLCWSKLEHRVVEKVKKLKEQLRAGGGFC